jgi:hypothetical protein
LYRQMYANTGMTTDSARVARSAKRARILARFAHRLFMAKPMHDLQVPGRSGGTPVAMTLPLAVSPASSE